MQQSLPLMDPETLENALIVASMAHRFAKTPKQSERAWQQLQELKRQRDQQRRAA